MKSNRIETETQFGNLATNTEHSLIWFILESHATVKQIV